MVPASGAAAVSSWCSSATGRSGRVERTCDDEGDDDEADREDDGKDGAFFGAEKSVGWSRRDQATASNSNELSMRVRISLQQQGMSTGEARQACGMGTVIANQTHRHSSTSDGYSRCRREYWARAIRCRASRTRFAATSAASRSSDIAQTQNYGRTCKFREKKIWRPDTIHSHTFSSAHYQTVLFAQKRICQV